MAAPLPGITAAAAAAAAAATGGGGGNSQQQQQLLRPPRKYTPSETTQIYTDWANHYLEKVKSKRRIVDLPNDVTDGCILADVIEAVTNQKLPDVNRKPRTASQMTDNIATCLRLLTALGIQLEDVTSNDIHQGNLKSILTVFFALSRYKQQQKHQQQEMAKIPIAKTNFTAIPVGKKGQIVSKIVPSSVHYGSPQLRPLSSAATSAASSRSASPSLCSTGSGQFSATNGSMIPHRASSKTSSPSVTRINSIKTPVVSHPSNNNKQSMLEKFKLFNKPSENKSVVNNVPTTGTTTLSKRPSSSSGFSSARSEQSDASFTSSNNLMTPLTTLAVFDQPPLRKTVPNNVQLLPNGTKERSIRTRSKNSPKLSLKVRRTSETEEGAGFAVNNKMSESQILSTNNKPFGSTGIPKPTAAVKGTAKIVKKNATEEAGLERTPGDGKEVIAISSKLHKTAVLLKPSQDGTQSPRASNFLGSSLLNTQSTQRSSQGTLKCTANSSSNVCPVTTNSEPTSQPPISQGDNSPVRGEDGNLNNLDFTTEEALNQYKVEPLSHIQDQTVMEAKQTVENGAQLFNGHVAKVLPMSNNGLNQPVTSDHLGCTSTEASFNMPLNEEDEDESMNVQPMTPLFNSNHLGLKRVDNLPSSNGNSATAKRAANISYCDPLDGYLSEGGASAYARKLHYLAMNQRSKDDDSFDDSSSLSSGISDPWNEVYGLHLKMENGSVYPGIPNGYGTPLQNRRYPPSVTESSPYKQISSSQWKKFIEAGRLPSSDRFQAEIWKNEVRERAKSHVQEASSPKATELKRLNTVDSGKRSKVLSESDTGERLQPAKGVPVSFGYVKKSSVHPGMMGDLKRIDHSSLNGKGLTYKTANVTTVPKLVQDSQNGSSISNSNQSLERPKTRLKVSGGTQTDMGGAPRTIKPSQYKSSTLAAPLPSSLNGHHTYSSYSDSEYQTPNGVGDGFKSASGHTANPSAGKNNYQATFKSYSLTAPIANQLSNTVRERLLLNGSQSLPKSPLNQIKDMEDKRQAHANFAAHLFAGVSELNTETDLNLDYPGVGNGSGNKLRDKDKSTKYVVNGRNIHTDGSLSDTPYTAYWNKYHPKNGNDNMVSDPESLDSISLHHGPKLSQWLNNPPSPRLNRSNSVRSTKSEKVYSSMLQRNDESEINNFSSQTLDNGIEVGAPSSHRYSSSSNGVHPASRSSLGNYSALLSLSRMGSKDEDCHGSSLSLVSTASSLYSSQEEKQASEIRKLKRELAEANEKVNTLSGQLSTNAHVVAAFEQSLASMTSRLQSLTMTAEQKENELQELRQFIDQMRKQNVNSGRAAKSESTQSNSTMTRQLSSDSVSSITSQVTSLSSISSSSPNQPLPPCSPSPSLKKKSWLRNSFSKAFSRSKRPPGSNNLRHGTGSDSEDSSCQLGSTWSAPSSPMLAPHQSHHQHSTFTSDEANERQSTPDAVKDLKKQLREKDMVLTDIRLEALSSAHQLEGLKETVNRMRNEMLTLKQDNERLQRQAEQQSDTSSPNQTVERSASHRSSVDESFIVTDYMLGLENDKESKCITVFLQVDESVDQSSEPSNNQWIIGYAAVSGKTRWDHLDLSVRKLFTDYLHQVDPSSHLGLDGECLWYYRVGEVIRSLVSEECTVQPELLPCGYFVGDCNDIYVYVKTTSKYALPACLTLDILVPLPVLNRYVSLVTEHRRVIICGPSGTGKSFLARKLAEYCSGRDEKSSTSSLISTLKIDATSCKEVRQFLSHTVECFLSGNCDDVPDVIILEDLHLAPSLNEIFTPLIQLDSAKACTKQFPYLIGTTGPMTQSSANLQLQFNFRWILLANHTEPVQGLIKRFLRRRLIQSELKTKSRSRDLERIIEWIPRCWSQFNKFLETHNSTDVTVGPRWFLQVPVDLTCSQIWFTDFWNYTMGPYLLHAAKEGLQLYGKRAPWDDPCDWIKNSYPWSRGSAYDALMRLRAEDVGYDIASRPKSLNTTSNQDPLYNMLVKLQEAANLPSPTEYSSESQISGSEWKGE